MGDLPAFFFGINLIYLSTMVLTIQSMGGEME